RVGGTFPTPLRFGLVQHAHPDPSFYTPKRQRNVRPRATGGPRRLPCSTTSGLFPGDGAFLAADFLKFSAPLRPSGWDPLVARSIDGVGAPWCREPRGGGPGEKVADATTLALGLI